MAHVSSHLSQKSLHRLLMHHMQEDVERGQHEGDCAEQLDQDVQRGASGIFERIADGIADDAGFVASLFLPRMVPLDRRGATTSPSAFTRRITGLDILLGVVPGAAAVVKEESHHDAAHRAHHQQYRPLLEGRGSCRSRWYQYSDDARQDHRAQGAARADVHAAGIVRIYALGGSSAMILDFRGTGGGPLRSCAWRLCRRREWPGN